LSIFAFEYKENLLFGLDTIFHALTAIVPIVYTFGMNTYAVINIKTDPRIKERAMRAAEKLGVSLNAVLNNELRRFALEESVTFDTPAAPNAQTQRALVRSRKQIERDTYYRFSSNKKALAFLRDQLR